jgi:hypothetical protein
VLICGRNEIDTAKQTSKRDAYLLKFPLKLEKERRFVCGDSRVLVFARGLSRKDRRPFSIAHRIRHSPWRGFGGIG